MNRWFGVVWMAVWIPLKNERPGVFFPNRGIRGFARCEGPKAQGQTQTEGGLPNLANDF